MVQFYGATEIVEKDYEYQCDSHTDSSSNDEHAGKFEKIRPSSGNKNTPENHVTGKAEENSGDADRKSLEDPYKLLKRKFENQRQRSKLKLKPSRRGDSGKSTKTLAERI